MNLDSYLCFFDNSPKFPSVFLNNNLHKYLKIYIENPSLFAKNENNDSIIRIILIKDKISRYQLSEEESLPSLDNSFYCEVVLHSQYNYQGLDKNEEKVNIKI